MIFLDINMFMMNGWDFLNRMNEEGLKCHVIVASSNISQEDMDRAKEYDQVVDYYTGPLNLNSVDGFSELWNRLV